MFRLCQPRHRGHQQTPVIVALVLLGCVAGLVVFVGLLVALVMWGLLAWWLEGWRWKRVKKRENEQ